MPARTVIHFERLRNDYGMEGLESSIERAIDSIMEKPVKTFEWLAQYEEVPLVGKVAYEEMSREQPCDLAL